MRRFTVFRLNSAIRLGVYLAQFHFIGFCGGQKSGWWGSFGDWIHQNIAMVSNKDNQKRAGIRTQFMGDKCGI